jgi:hypothetical protein
MRPIAAPVNITPPNIITPRTQRSTHQLSVTGLGANRAPYSHIMIGTSTASTTAVAPTNASPALIGRNLIPRAMSATIKPAISGEKSSTMPQNSEAGT